MIAKLRTYHRLGQEANLPASKRSTKQFGERHKLHLETARKVRAFGRLYSQKELKELCSLYRPNGLPLQWGHVTFLLTVADKATRATLQRRAAAEGWTAPVLYAEIRRRHLGGSSRKGGRPVKVPSTPTACLRQIITEGQPWLKRCESMRDALADMKLKRKGDRDMAVEAAALLRNLARHAGMLAKELEGAGR
jgi:hypothetical protein